ncbi:MAG: lytic transglycosylase domain-containing protein [Candidatus Eisenbacteria bacterium]
MEIKPIPLAAQAAASGAESDGGARAQAMAKAEREFHAMLLREMLRPLTQALFSNAGSFSPEGANPLGSGGSDTYAYFLENALSEQLSQAWPLPSPFGGEETTTATPSSGFPLDLSGGPTGRAPVIDPLESGAPLPVSLDRARDVLRAATRNLPPSLRSAASAVSPPVRAATIPTDASSDGTRAIGSVPPASRDIGATGSLPALSRETGDIGSVPVPSRETGAIGSAPLVLRGTGANGSVPLSSQETESVFPLQTESALAPRSASEPASPRLPDAEIRRASRLFDVPENLVRAVVLTESGGRSQAVSPKGAVGYMQVMPDTAREMGASDLRDPWQNVYAGTKYLRRQLDRFGSVEHALAAYNAGPGAVEKHGGIPPYRETRNYVQRVLAWKARLDGAGS